MPSPLIPLTHARLKELIHYDPLTGIFTAASVRANVKIGQKMGWRHKKGYWLLKLDGTHYRGNRVAWFWMMGEWPKDQIDHENRTKDDDRWINLRPATNTQNARNNSLSKRNTSGHKGVHWGKRLGRWVASIRVNRKLIHLGYFDDLEPAIAARKEAEQKYFGEFAAA